MSWLLGGVLWPSMGSLKYWMMNCGEELRSYIDIGIGDIIYRLSECE